MTRHHAHVTVIGSDKSGVIARICQFLFECGGNIEELDQHVTRGQFSMHLEVSWPATGHTTADMQGGLERLGDELGMNITFRSDGAGLRRLGVLVTKERHAPAAVLDAVAAGDVDAEVVVMIGNHPDLSDLAAAHGVPFVHVPDQNKKEHEAGMIAALEAHGVDVVVLARYMRILSPDFVWRYPHRIVNIHPSLLPAFPGAVPYRQALERGVRVAGVTAHLVTTDLDQGPILAQESFPVPPDAELSAVVAKGRELESKALVDGVRLVVEDAVEVGWGRTWHKP